MPHTKTSKPPRIAIVTNMPAPYRAPVFDRVAEALGIENFLVIYCSEKESNRDWVLEPDKFNTQFLKKKTLVWNEKYIHYNFDIWPALKKFNPDVVITTGFYPTSLIAFIYTLLYKKIHIPWTDGTFDLEKNFSIVHRIARRIVFKYSKTFLGASQGSLVLYESYGINKKLFFQSHLSTNNASYYSPPFNARPFDLMFSGRIAVGKHPLFALDVAAGVAKVLNRKISLLMLGAGPLLEQVQNYAKTLAPEVEVTFPGFVQQSELPGFYSQAKVFLFPSAFDAWGLVANEACAAGQAVLISPHAGAAHDLICDDENGYVLDLELPLWIEHAVVLLSNPDQLEQFSQNSLKKVQSYTYDAGAKGLVDAIKASIDLP